MERGTKYKKARSKVDLDKEYSAKEAVDLVKDISYASFGGTVEAKINLSIDTKESDQNVRFITKLPHPTGKERKVLAFTEKKIKSSDYKTLDVIKGNEKSIEQIQEGNLNPGSDFNFVVAEPKFMQQIAKAARILGPRGLMPSPKTNTVGDVEEILKNLDKGQIEIRNQPGNRVIHLTLGSVDESAENIVENFNKAMEEIKKNRPPSVKKVFLESAYLKATMSPSVKVDISDRQVNIEE